MTIIEKVHIVENWTRQEHQVVVVGRLHADAPRAWLAADGTWHAFEEGSPRNDDSIGLLLPEGVLDAIVAAHQGVTAPTPAIERHLNDAVAVRDRLLAIVERPAQ